MWCFAVVLERESEMEINPQCDVLQVFRAEVPDLGTIVGETNKMEDGWKLICCW